jgi:hypothetical protein
MLRFSFSTLVFFYFIVETFFLARLQPLSVPAQLLCSLQWLLLEPFAFPLLAASEATSVLLMGRVM